MTWLEPPFSWEAPGLNAGERQVLYAAWCQEVREDQELKYLERTGARPKASSGLVRVIVADWNTNAAEQAAESEE